MYAVTTRNIPVGDITPCELCAVLPLDFLEDGDVFPESCYVSIVLVPFQAGMAVSTLIDSVLAAYRPMSYQQITQVWEVSNA